ncbi:MAG: hypothetical protein PHG03_04420 [Bacilli bacterium]|nr:hypothetical protein [Bacilli bacterium]MDD4795782.1 hypothetical protein [Bacilli bacterium]
MKKKLFVLIVIFIPLIAVLGFLHRTDIKMRVLGYKIETFNCKLEDEEYFLDYKKNLKTGTNMDSSVYQVFLKTNKGNLYEVPFDSFGWNKNLNIQKFSSGENCRKIMSIAGYECSYLENSYLKKDNTQGVIKPLKYCYFYDNSGNILTSFGEGAGRNSSFKYDVELQHLIILNDLEDMHIPDLNLTEIELNVLPVKTEFGIEQQLYTLSPFNNQVYMYINNQEEIEVVRKVVSKNEFSEFGTSDDSIQYQEKKLLNLREFLTENEKVVDLYVSNNTVFIITDTSIYKLNSKMVLNKKECETYADVECKKGYGLQKVNYEKYIENPIFFVSQNKKTVIITNDKIYIKDYRN